MKKTIPWALKWFMALTLVFSFVSYNQAKANKAVAQKILPDYETYFELSSANTTKPLWFSDYRGFTADAENLYFGKPNVIQVVNRKTGELIGNLNTTGVTAAWRNINDLEISSDGVIFAASGILSPNDKFRVWMISKNPDVEPVLVIEHDFLPDYAAVRVGDKFTVVGGIADGSLAVYAAESFGTAANLVYRWQMTSVNEGVPVFGPMEVITISQKGGSSQVAPLPNGHFYHTGVGILINKFDETGNLIGTIPIAVAPTGTTAIKYLGKDGKDELLAVYHYNPGYIRLVRIPEGNPANAILEFRTPSLGISNSAGSGDVAFIPAADGKNVDVYVMDGSDGIAGYSTNNLNMRFPLYSPHALVQIIHNSADPAAALVDIYVNGNLAIEDFAFRSSTPYIALPSGVLLKIDVVPAGQDITASVGTFDFTLEQDEKYSLIASGLLSVTKEDGNGAGPNTSFNLFAFPKAREWADVEKNTDVLAFHGITDAGEVSVWLRNGTNELFAFEFGDFAGYLELPTDNYDLELRSADGSTLIASYVAPLKDLGLEGSAITLIASGLVNPAPGKTDPSFGLYAVLPSGGEVVALPEYVPLAQLQIIHNSADPAAEIVDIFVNGELFIEDFGFRTATPFVTVEAEVELTIDIAPADLGIVETVGTFKYTLNEDGVYVVVASGLLAEKQEGEASVAFDLFDFANARTKATDEGNTDLLVFHGITDAPEVSVRLRKATENLFSFSFGEFAGYLEVPTANLELELVVTEDGSVVETYVAPLEHLGLEGQAITVLASGMLTAPIIKADSPSFGLFVALADGGKLIELPIYDPYAWVQIIHNSADPAAEKIDMYANGELVLEEVSFRTATEFLRAPAELEQKIDIVPTGLTLAESVFTRTITFKEDSVYVIVASGLLPEEGGVVPDKQETDTSFNLFIYEKGQMNAADDANTDVLVFHGSTDAPTVSVWAGGQTPAELFAFSFGEFTEKYLELPSKTYILEVRSEDGETVVASYVAPLGVLGLEGQAITVLASGFLTGDNPTFGLFAALTSGGALVPLPLLEDVTTYALTLVSDPIEAGTFEGEGNYLEGQMVAVTATPATGNMFLNWVDKDGEVVSLNPVFSYEMPSQVVELTANFASIPEPMVFNTYLDKTGANYPAQLGTGGVARSAALYQNRYVVSPNRTDGININVWDALNPHLPPTKLSNGTDIIAPLTFPVNYVRTVDEDIYISNLSLNPEGAGWGQGVYRVYRWNSLTAEPEIVISYNKLPGRLGDAISIIGDPAKDGKIIAHINTTKSFRVWNFKDGVLLNEDTPDLISIDIKISDDPDRDNLNNHGIINSIEGETDIFVATSNNTGIMLVDLTGKVLAYLPTTIVDFLTYDPNIFYYDGKRYLSYTINNTVDATVGARYQIVDISFGETVVDAFNLITSSEIFNKRIVYDKPIGAGDASLTGVNQVAFDEDGEFMMLSFVVNKGFFLETSGALPEKFALTLDVTPAETGTVTGAGDYYEGATVPLTATPANGYLFANWKLGDVELSTESAFTYTMPGAATTLTANFEEIPVTDVATLAELRTKPADGTRYRYTGEASIVAMDGSRNRKFIQDATAAILIDDNPGVITTTYDLYDVITNVEGVINISFGMVRFQPTKNAEASTKNLVVTPAVTALNVLTTADEAKLVRFENVTFKDLTADQVFVNATNYTLTDGTNEFVLRTDFADITGLTGEKIPTGAVNINGVLISYSGEMQIVPRMASDIEVIPTTFAVTFNVDMTPAENFDPATDVVYITGQMFGWAEPGTQADKQTMTRVDQSMIWTTTLNLEAGTYAYKYYKGAGFTNGEWDGDPNRSVTVASDMVVNNVWRDLVNVDHLTVSSINVYPNPARDYFMVEGAGMIRSLVISDITGKVVYNNVVNDTQTRINQQFGTGIYIMHIHTDEGVIVRKLQIQK
jgi:hypothetical protein